MCRKNAGHGRIEKRNCTVVSYGSIMEKMFKKKLVGLKSVVKDKVGKNNRDRKSTRLNSSHIEESRMPSSA